MGVLAIWRYPVKAMLGEMLEAVDIAAGRLDSDRRWVVSDIETGEDIANKRGPTDAGSRACRARLGARGELAVMLPDGVTEIVGSVAIAAALSELLGRDVELVEHAGGGSRPGERLERPARSAAATGRQAFCLRSGSRDLAVW